MKRQIPRLLAALSLATLSTPAWAYLDPSTGSMILSAIVGIFATLGLAVKTYWYKLKNAFRGRNPAATAPASRAAQSAKADDRTPRDASTD